MQVHLVGKSAIVLGWRTGYLLSLFCGGEITKKKKLHINTRSQGPIIWTQVIE